MEPLGAVARRASWAVPAMTRAAKRARVRRYVGTEKSWPHLTPSHGGGFYLYSVGFVYYHLHEPDVRSAIVAAWHEERSDLAANWPRGQCYGKQLTDVGWLAFERAMPEALADHDDDWLIGEMAD